MQNKFSSYFDLIKKIGLKKVLFCVFAIFLILVFIFFFLLKKLSYSLIETHLSNFLGLKIELIHPNTYFDSKLSLITKADSINIYNITKTKKFVSIEKPNIAVKPFSIMFKKVNLKNFSAKNITIEISRDKDNKIDILESLNLENIKKINLKNYILTRMLSNVEKVTLIFNDFYETNTKISANIENSAICFSRKSKKLKVHQLGTIETNAENNKNISTLLVDIDSIYPFEKANKNNSKLDIKISDFDLTILSDLAKKYISKDITKISGNAQLNINKDTQSDAHSMNLIMQNPILYLQDKAISTYKTIELNSLFKVEKDNLKFQDFNLISNQLNVNLKGHISKIFSKNPQVNLTMKIFDTQLNNFLYFIPDNLIYYRPQGIPALKKSNFFAQLGGNLNIETEPLSITGNLKASNIYIPNYPKSSRQNDVNAFFMKDKVRIYTKIFTPQDEFVTIDGTSNLDNSLYGQYSVKSSKKVDLEFAKLYLMPVQQIIGFNIGPVPIMDIKGTGNIDIKTKGTIFDGQIFGTFNAQNTSAKIEGLDAKITQGDCKLIFDNRNLIFKEIKGKIDNATFLLTGMGNIKGDVDLNTTIKNITTSKLIQIFKNSEVTSKYGFLTNKISATSGMANANVNLKGKINDYETKELLNELKPSGKIELLNNKVILNNKLSAKNITGEINFGEKQTADLKFNINDSKISFGLESADALDKITKNSSLNIKTKISSQEFNSYDLFSELNKSNLFQNANNNIINQLQNLKLSTKFDIKSHGQISLNNFNIENLKNDGYIVGLNKKGNNIIFNTGAIKLADNKLFFDSLELGFMGGKIKFNGNTTNYLTKHPQNNFFISLKNINLEHLNLIIKKIKLKNSTLNNGLVVAKNNEIRFESFNFDYQSMPVFLNAEIKNIFGKKTLLAKYSTILNEQTTDNTINTLLVSPIKIKNEVLINGVFNGQSDNYSIDVMAKVPQGSDISFSGSNLGDTNHDREILGRIDVNKNIVNIKNLRLVKLIKNQNKKINPVIFLKAEGKITQQDSDINFDNFKITTHNPTNVRILNSIFKKSLLKKGSFECNLNLNGNSKLPKINGKISLFDLDIPLYDTEINSMKFNLADKNIDGEIYAKNKKSDVKIYLKAQNKLVLPINLDRIDILSNNLDLHEVLLNKPKETVISDIFPRQEGLKTQDIIINNGSINIKEISYDKINAQNLYGRFSYNDNIFNLKTISADIASGKIEAIGKYNTKSSKMHLITKINNCDSNALAGQFLNIQNQIFGKINGTAIIDAKSTDTPESIKDLKSEIDFAIENGKMPKLGSMEYLLVAGNIFKNGIFGLSLNNLIQVLTPYKTGEFEKISGNLKIEDAKVKNLEVYSKGKNLSLFMEGDYNILENFANFKIYGKLSQNLSNVLGKVGNASLSQFFNAISDISDIKSEKKKKNIDKLSKIPPIENEEQNPRFFIVKVLGDINKDNYIKSFNWE